MQSHSIYELRSAKDRSWEAIRGTCTKVRNGLKINDWNGVQTAFDELSKHMEKARTLIAREGVPNFYVSYFYISIIFRFIMIEIN